MIQTKNILKTYFETGDYPTESQFGNLIDSFRHIDDGATILSIKMEDNGGATFNFSTGDTLTIERSALPESMPISFIEGLQGIIDNSVTVSQLNEAIATSAYGIKYSWNTATQRNAQTGMKKHEQGVQKNSREVYKYTGNAWELFYTLDAVHNHDDRYYTESESDAKFITEQRAVSDALTSTSSTTAASSKAIKTVNDKANNKLDKTAKAADSDKLNGLDSTAFARTSHSHAWSQLTGVPLLFPTAPHTHDDRYYTEAESNARFLGKTAKAVDSDKLDGKDSTYFVALTNIVDSLTSTAANKPLSAKQGKVLKGLIDNINSLLTSNDTSLDEIQEIVNYIKQNKSELQNLGVSNIAGLQEALNTKEASFTKNTAFNKNFGTTAGTVAKGNHAHSWSQITGKPTTFPASTHNHNNLYYTETESNARFLGKTAKAVDADKLDGKDSTYFVALTNIVDSLTSTAANKPLSAKQGKVLKGLIDNINSLLTSNDTSLDEIQEIVNYIKQNKSELQNLGVSNIAGLQAALNTKEASFTKNTAFNKNFGTTAGTVAKGNHAHSWNQITGKPTTFPASTHNHNNLYYTETESNARFLGKTAKAVDSDKLDGLDSSVFMRSNADDSFSGKIYSSTRQGGIYGQYNSKLIDHIWSMGTGYKIASDGSNFGNLYGFGYKHTNNPTGGSMASGHQAVWCENGAPKVALGSNIWTKGAYRRGSHSTGHLEGSYNNVGDNSKMTNPIYTIGSSYKPTDSTLGNMYGIGFSKGANASFLNSTDLGINPPSSWGMYVAADGNARIFLNGTHGHGYFKGNIYSGGNLLATQKWATSNFITKQRAISNLLTSTSSVVAASSQAIKTVNDKVNTASKEIDVLYEENKNLKEELGKIKENFELLSTRISKLEGAQR